MKQKFFNPLVLAFFAFFLFGSVSACFIPSVNAQTGDFGSVGFSDNTASSDVFNVFSPKEVCYNKSSVTLNFSLTAHSLATICYSLDNGSVQSLKTEYLCAEEINYPPFLSFSDSSQLTVMGDLVLENLPNGNHVLRLYHGHQTNYGLSYEVETVEEVKFSVAAPVVLLRQGLDCYAYDSIPLNLIVSESTRLLCSIDNQANVTIRGNTTLTNLSAGCHNVTVYAFNRVGSCGVSNTINFEVLEHSADSHTPDASEDNEKVFPYSICLVLFFVVLIFSMTAVVKYLEKGIEGRV